jgi:hypothetical protein
MRLNNFLIVLNSFFIINNFLVPMMMTVSSAGSITRFFFQFCEVGGQDQTRPVAIIAPRRT